jgi:transposase
MTEEAASRGGLLTEKEKRKICYLKGQGLSNRKIAASMNRSASSIDRFMRVFANPAPTVPPGEPLIDVKFVLNEYVLAATLEDRFLSCRDLSARLSRDFKLSCSKSQVAIVR